jgi:hypothetical protein
MNQAIAHGLRIARILGKELCLFHIQRKPAFDTEAKLKSITEELFRNNPQMRIHYFLQEKSLSNLLTDLAETHDCILLVAHKKQASKILPDLKYAGFPFLFISAEDRIEEIYKEIVVPVTYMKKSKDLALWASYIGRHHQSMIHLYASAESSSADEKEVKRHLFSIERLYSKFSFPFRVIQGRSATWRLQKEALDHTIKLKSALLVISASYNTTFIDRMMGLTEYKVISKSEELSVLCINSQRDFYTFCG